MTALLLGLSTFVSTLFGGLFALRFKDQLHLILGFSAGAVIAVAFFDLLPEAIALAGDHRDTAFVTSIAAAGFMFYMVLDRAVGLRPSSSDRQRGKSRQGRVGAATLCAHSFLDGLAIGLAFQVSPSVGAIVAIAVLVHDFSDGINTVNFVLINAGTPREARRWLFLDAVAPVLGVISTLFFALPESSLGIVLGLFAGFFLYIGASDLLPESYHAHPTMLSTLMTLLGAGLLYVAIRLAT